MEIVFTTHALRRMLSYGICSRDVCAVIETGERIEEYPDDRPLPSYLASGLLAGSSTSSTRMMR